jgi:hypothetical protein
VIVGALLLGSMAGVLVELVSGWLNRRQGKLPYDWMLRLAVVLALWVWSPRYDEVPVAVATYAVAVAALTARYRRLGTGTRED